MHPLGTALLFSCLPLRCRGGWRAIRTFNAASGEWRLTALGKRWFADHEGLPEYVIRIPAIFDVHRSGRPNARYEGWFPYELLELEMLLEDPLGEDRENRQLRTVQFSDEAHFRIITGPPGAEDAIVQQYERQVLSE